VQLTYQRFLAHTHTLTHPSLYSFKLLGRLDSATLKMISEQNRLSVYKACAFIHKKSHSSDIPFSPVVKRNIEATDLGESSQQIYFQASLQGDGSLRLNPPDFAFDKRIYRAFGCDRFLEVLVGKNIETDTACTFLTKPLFLFGRTYRLLWCKKGNKPQSYMYVLSCSQSHSNILSNSLA
jgi:hypothetical protein